MNYQILINKTNPIPENFIKQNQLVKASNYMNENIYVEKVAYKSYQHLNDFLSKKKGINIGIIDSYRSIDDQREVYKELVVKYGKEHADKYVAPPGTSEHHSGLAIDISIKVDDLWCEIDKDYVSHEKLFKEVHKYLKDYGFILRYPLEKEEITGYPYEPWHIRYVGNELSNALDGLTLEEFYNLHKNR